MMIRAELISSHDEVWKQLARPGARLSGAERVAIAAEVRQARSCAFCKARKGALSPNAVRGWHDQADRDMPGARVELVHKLTTDPGRVTRSWVDGLIADGMEEVEYIEVAGLLSAVIVVDTFRAALGLPLRELPLPVDGVPHGQTPETAVKEDSYVPMIPVNGLAADYIDLYDDRYFVPNVQRAFSLVPEATRLAATLMASHYVPYEMVARYTDADHSYGVNKMQMELIAARVSMYNDCFYWTTAHAALLRVGSLESETEVDLAVLGKTSGDGGIPHGELLNNFVDATLSFDAAATTERRKLLRQAIGDDGLVDAAAVAAMFQLNTRAADAAGVSVEAATLEGRERIGASLGFASRDMGEAPWSYVQWLTIKSLGWRGLQGM